MQFHFEKLTVWKDAMELVTTIYRLTRAFPTDEQFGMVSQLRRAAVSVSANIAEGRGRYHRKDFIQFLYVARGSLYETITLIKAAASLQYLPSKDQEPLLMQWQRIGGKLSGLINALRSLPRTPK